MRSTCRLLAQALVLLAIVVCPAWASPVLIGNNITFELRDNGIGYPDPLSDVRLIAAAGQGINQDDGSNIGGSGGSGPMLDGEYIHVFDTSVQFSLFGGDASNEVQANYFATGYGASARYVLSGLFNPADAEITGVTIGLTNVVNVDLSDEVLFDAHSVTLYIGTLGILESASNLGQVRLSFTIRVLNDLVPGPGPGPGPDPGPAVVPEPGTLALLGSGVVAGWWRRRRTSTSRG